MAPDMVRRTQSDILIVGAGVGSCVAAIEAAKFGSVVVVDKGRTGRSGSNVSSGGQGVAASFGHFDISSRRLCPDDGPQAHYDDTLRTAEGVCDRALVSSVCDGVRDRVRETEACGVRYAKTPDGRFFLQRGGFGHAQPRICLCGSGWDFVGALAKEVYFRGVTVINRCMIFALAVVDGVCRGAFGTDLLTGELCIFESGAVILSSGSATGLQRFSSACYRTTGDSFAAAYEAGAELADMEFTEFTMVPAPGGAVIPTSGISPYIGRGAVFYNEQGERFMERYDPVNLERGTRSRLVQAVYEEMRAGRGPCYLDATVFSPAVWDDFIREEPDVVRKVRALVDPRRERVQWVPALHSFLGGIRVDIDGRTNVPGLYAAGEAATGMHGANRLGGNAVAACYVTGYRAARAASRHVRSEGRGPLPAWSVRAARDRLTGLTRDRGEAPHHIERRIRDLAWESIGIVRDGDGLARGARGFAELRTVPIRATQPRDLARAIGLQNLALTGQLVASSAAVRTESRGQHKRSDHPHTEAGWDRHIIIDQRQGVRSEANCAS